MRRPLIVPAAALTLLLLSPWMPATPVGASELDAELLSGLELRGIGRPSWAAGSPTSR